MQATSFLGDLFDFNFNDRAQVYLLSPKKNRILVIDKDPKTSKMLKLVVSPDKFTVEQCLNGKGAVNACATLKPDIILLDPDLPDADGFEVIKALRACSNIPLIILSSLPETSHLVKALECGADDYVTKPFNPIELEARVNASLRRGAVYQAGAALLSAGPLRIDLVRHQVFLNERILSLTPKEYNLLRYFLVHRGKMMTHKEILQEIWGRAYVSDAQYLRVFIGQLRKKIDVSPQKASMIQTEPGIGYKMVIDDGSEMPQQPGQQTAPGISQYSFSFDRQKKGSQ